MGSLLQRPYVACQMGSHGMAMAYHGFLARGQGQCVEIRQFVPYRHKPITAKYTYNLYIYICVNNILYSIISCNIISYSITSYTRMWYIYIYTYIIYTHRFHKNDETIIHRELFPDNPQIWPSQSKPPKTHPWNHPKFPRKPDAALGAAKLLGPDHGHPLL